MLQLQSYITLTLKTPSTLSIWFQRYSHLREAQNNEIQRKLNAIIGFISKSKLGLKKRLFDWRNVKKN